MKDDHYQIIGLLGFIVAGVIFVVIGVQTDDILTIIGSAIWIISCLIWIIPLIKKR